MYYLLNIDPCGFADTSLPPGGKSVKQQQQQKNEAYFK